VELKANVWRPKFYHQISDWEFQPPKSGGQARSDMTGIAGTRPGVTGYKLQAADCWATKAAAPAGVVDEGERTLNLRLRAGQSCKVAITSVNDAYPSGLATFPNPQATVSLQQLKAGKEAMRKASLRGVDFHFYQFTAVPGKTVKFCTVLNDDGDCEDRGAKVSGKDTVIEIWGPSGRLNNASDYRDGESQVEWTPTPGQGGVYHALVRGGYLCGALMPCDGSYILTYMVPAWPSGLPLDPFANLTVKKLTPTTATLMWPSSAVAAQGDPQAVTELTYYYEVRQNSKTVLMAGSTLPLQVSERLYTFPDLTPGREYTLGVRLVTNEVQTDWVEETVTTPLETPAPQIAFAGWSGGAGGSYAVTVSWPAVAGASGYEDTFDVSPGEVEAAREGGGTASRFECQGEAQRTGRTRKYCNLEPSGMYEVSVTASATRADNKVVTSEAGTAVACLGPCGLRVSGLTTSGLRLDWEGLRPGVLIHNVRLRQGGRVVKESATPRRGFNFSGLSLQPETSYRAEVRTLYRGMRGYTPCAGVEFTTPEAPPPEPLALTVTPSAASCLTGETIEISWSVEGGSGSYTVSLDGAEQADVSAEVVCQATAGAQTVSLVARDTVHTTLSSTQRVTLTVSAPKVSAPAGLSVAAEVTALTLGWQAVSGATAYGVRIDGGAEASLEATKTSHEFSGLEPSTKHMLSVRAYIGTDHSLWATIEGTTLAPPALVLTATATPTSCETNAAVTVSWSVTGGSGSYAVSVDGTAQSGSAVQVTCQAEAGTQNVTVLATDATYRQLTATQTLSLTVTKPAPPATVEAQVRARRLSDHRVEFVLRLTGGSDLTTAKRYLKLPEATAGRWYASGAYTATVAGVDYTLGVVSARLDNTVCPAQVEVTFIATGGERITPERYKFPVDREADLWAATTEFAVPLKPATDSVRVQADSGAVMTEAPAGAADGPGREGGLMFGDTEQEAARAQGAETVCTAQPTGLVTSAITSSGARLAWGKVTGASEYDAAAGEGEPEALDAAQLVHDFTGLAADTDHTLRVRARSWHGSSKWSAVVVRTKPSSLPVVTITAGASPISEGQDAGFTITSDRMTAAALTVKLSVTESGDVTSGAGPSEATIAAGARTAAVAVATEDDGEEEADSVVTATLLAGSGYRLGSVSSAAVTVNDDERGSPFELFATLGKAGGCAAAQTEAIGRLVSLALRSGAPVDIVHSHLRGITCHRPTGFGPTRVLSCGDAIAQVVALRMSSQPEGYVPMVDLQGEGTYAPPSVTLEGDRTEHAPVAAAAPAVAASPPATGHAEAQPTMSAAAGMSFAGACPSCGSSHLVSAEGCLKCISCGYSDCG